jgi:DNA-directed RNA polymerase specialized sigma24 family protein
MAGSDELSTSICQLKDVSELDAERIWHEFFPKLKRYAQKRIRDMATRTFDEEDVALSAINSFFRGHAAGRFDELAGDEELWRLLVTITARKVTAKRRKQLAAKRGGGNVRGESVFLAAGESELNVGLAQIMDENRMPESASEVAKTCKDLLAVLPNEKLRETALMRMEGYTNKEISEKLKWQCCQNKTASRSDQGTVAGYQLG